MRASCNAQAGDNDRRNVGVAVRCLHCSSEAWDVEEHGFSRFLAQHDHSDEAAEMAAVVPIGVKSSVPYSRQSAHDAGSVLLLPLHSLARDLR